MITATKSYVGSNRIGQIKARIIELWTNKIRKIGRQGDYRYKVELYLYIFVYICTLKFFLRNYRIS